MYNPLRPFANIFCSIFGVISGIISLGFCLLVMFSGDPKHISDAKEFSFGCWIGFSFVLIVLCSITTCCVCKDHTHYVVVEEYGWQITDTKEIYFHSYYEWNKRITD